MVTPSPNRYASVEQILVGWIKTVLGYENVATELPTNLTFLMPLVVVEKFGGTDDTITLDVSRVDIDCLAPTRADALAHGEHIRQAIRTKLRGYTVGGVTFGQAHTIGAPTAAPFDSKHRVRRCTASYQILTHHFTGVS